MSRLDRWTRRLVIVLLLTGLRCAACEELTFRWAMRWMPTVPAHWNPEPLPPHVVAALDAERVPCEVEALDQRFVQQIRWAHEHPHTRPPDCRSSSEDAARVWLGRVGRIAKHGPELVAPAWFRRHLTVSERTRFWADHVWLGPGIFGLDAASRAYFEGPLDTLPAHRLAALIVLEQSPAKFLKRRQAWRYARDVHLRGMHHAGLLTDAQLAEALSHPLEALTPSRETLARRRAATTLRAP